MKHCFLVNVHDDLPQALRTVRILQRYKSRIFVDMDGGPYPGEALDQLIQMATNVEVNLPEPDKCTGIVQAMNRLMRVAYEADMELATFLHPDMVPVDKLAFRLFLDRFRSSAKVLACSSMWPGHPAISFCSLHFQVQTAYQLLFPIELESQATWFNEWQTTVHFDKQMRGWRGDVYTLWVITEPYTGQYHVDGELIKKKGHTMFGSFTFHDFCPETSVIHTNDPEFWNNYEELAR